MWLKWIQNQAREHPELWWRQLEAAPRAGLPFAHLFPQPPASRQPASSEACRLVRELVAADPPERMEEIVQAYQRRPLTRQWDPVEPWPVFVSGAGDAERAAWGDDGDQVLAWFDQGELLSAWPTAPVPRLDLSPEPRGFARLVAWLKGLIPKPDSLRLASAEH